MADERSYERITRAHLKRLARIARLEREDFFGRHREYAILYRKRILCTALCEDAALHYINGQTGVLCFDVFETKITIGLCQHSGYQAVVLIQVQLH